MPGHPQTPETRRKISASMKGKNTGPHSAEQKRSISDGMRDYWARRKAGNACASKGARAEVARAKIKEILGPKCFVCGVEPRKGYVVHHTSYHEDGVHYARSPSYHKGGGKWGSNDYALALVHEVERHPERFVPLCQRHHFAVGRMLNIAPDILSRLIDVLMRSYDK